MEKKRILHIMSSFGGGISSFIYNLSLAAENENLIFDVVTYDSVPDFFREQIESTGGEVGYLLNPKREGWRKFQQSFVGAIEGKEYHAVYCHISGYRSLAYYYLVREYLNHLKKHFYIHAHYQYQSEVSPFYKGVEQKVSRMVNRKCSSQAVGCSRVAIQSLYGLKKHEPFVVIPNSIDHEPFLNSGRNKEMIQNKWQEQFGERYCFVGHIGRLEAVKNHRFSFELVQKSVELGQPIHLFVIGSGRLENALKEQVQKMGIAAFVTFLGRVSPIYDVLGALDAIVLPSFSEGFGTVTIESQAAGVPVLVSHAVTDEVDLGFGLVERLALEEGPSVWIQELFELIKGNRTAVVSQEERRHVIESKAFSNQAACGLFRQMLDGKLNHYQLD
ncbi:glycosyltransferase [Facklamia sp. DSM 111018]|uniref:Glycosyltransferase n=1 Tax=Facklamia lactis TaxID=2749967 RepID=A0ABS0LRL9_9LACT|nr:glycosyltransferase [Facklamia lactis]MBG9980848.1 glycosyltransferase [Facklamia lactis]MBG9986789.1 glycosyltransferase [Facklamia lactis]